MNDDFCRLFVLLFTDIQYILPRLGELNSLHQDLKDIYVSRLSEVQSYRLEYNVADQKTVCFKLKNYRNLKRREDMEVTNMASIICRSGECCII